MPMKGRHETLGVLYLDTLSTARDVVARGSPTGKFTEDHLALAIAIAHQAALAVEETRYHQAMVQAERLAAIGQTIAALSHHIKNILQGLRSGSEILKMGLEDKDETLLQQGLEDRREEPGQDLRPGHGHAQLLEGARAGRSRNRPQRGGPRRGRGDAGAGEGVGRPAGLEAGRALPTVPGRSRGHPPRAAEHRQQRPGRRGGPRRRRRSAWARGWRPTGLGAHRGAGQRRRHSRRRRSSDIFRPFVSTKGSKGTGLGLAGQPQDPARARRRHPGARARSARAASSSCGCRSRAR